MKTCEEWVKEIEKKAETRLIQKKQRQKKVLQIASGAVCLTLVIAAATVLPKVLKPNTAIVSPPESKTEQGLNQPSSHSSDTARPPISSENPVASSKAPESKISPPSKDPKSESDKQNEAPADILFTINYITGQISKTPKYLDPNEHDTEKWTLKQITDYFKMDFAALGQQAFMPERLSYNENRQFEITYHNTGEIVRDFATFSYADADDNSRKLSIRASRIMPPYDCLYQTDGASPSHINDVEVNICGKQGPNEDNFSFLVADFYMQGVYYRITADSITVQEFYSFLRGFLQK